MGGITQEKLTYLTVSKGRMVNKKAGLDFGGYEGTFLGIREKIGEYEGKPQYRIELKMKDTQSDEIVIIQFTKRGFASLGLLSALQKVDLNKPFTIKVWGSEKNEKISFCGLQQEGFKYEEKRKTISPDKNFPKPKPVTINGEQQYDWAEVLPQMDRVVKEINDSRPGSVAAADAPGAPADTLVPTPDDDLPF